MTADLPPETLLGAALVGALLVQVCLRVITRSLARGVRRHNLAVEAAHLRQRQAGRIQVRQSGVDDVRVRQTRRGRHRALPTAYGDVEILEDEPAEKKAA
ncbi:MAG: hypothetical protein ACYSXF_05930 [Planctomycetota bacterium]|jgi:hypothetical protein